MGVEQEVFKNFMVTIPKGRRYWDDDTTGLLIKAGKPAEINSRLFRSSELKFSIIRHQVLLVSGECTFAFKNKLVKVLPGENKNIIIDLDSQGKIPEPVKEAIVEKEIVKKEEKKKLAVQK